MTENGRPPFRLYQRKKRSRFTGAPVAEASWLMNKTPPLRAGITARRWSLRYGPAQPFSPYLPACAILQDNGRARLRPDQRKRAGIGRRRGVETSAVLVERVGKPERSGATCLEARLEICFPLQCIGIVVR